MKIKHLALFNGIGGFQLAAQWMGWENVASVEIDDFCNKVTKHHFPNCIQHKDIKTFDGTIYRGAIDIITGGFPCQPFSTAGQRKGTEDNRYLWPEMLRIIREVQPRFIVGENVYGLVNWDGGVVFEQVCLDLENEGYEVQPVILPACGVNAPHQRNRVWFVAHSKSAGVYGEEGNICEADGRQGRGLLPELNIADNGYANAGTAPNAGSIDSPVPIQQRGQDKTENANADRCSESDVANTDGEGLQERAKTRFRINDSQASAPERREFTRAFTKENWREFPTQPPLCSRNDGLSYGLANITFPNWRTSSIKAMGNAIVPQVAYQIFKAIEQSI